MAKEKSTRRDFIRRSSVLGAGLFTMASVKGDVWQQSLKAPAREKIIDIHQHTDYSDRSNEALLAHQKTMGVDYTVLLPSGHPVSMGSTHYGVSNGLQAKATPNEACYQLAQQYKGIYFFGANEVPDVPDAVKEIEKYLKLGACVIGELKFNIDCDSKEMQAIYKLAQDYDVPVLIHFQYKMYNWGFERLHNMLRKYKKVNFIGHAQTWWANIDKNHSNQNILYPTGKVTPGGMTDMLLTRYDNVYGDLSAGSGLAAMTRDEDFTRSFLKRHQDKLIYGSDCSDSVGTGKACTGWQAIEAIRKLAPDKNAERKMFFDNANRLFKLKL
ncbi:amidohydrolase [Niabella sp. CC-SYL272]|uniref:amidohydrolase family protein n=1 Tax=Niabella agricola TaxID=2891571 RepID=UPI001F3C9B0B|nr:amidohydrolase family protein [Niabella agricola]MCF3108763.1 amidohydrolase [Niabella agricola]